MKSEYKINWMKNSLIIKAMGAGVKPPKFGNDSHKTVENPSMNWNLFFFGNNFTREIFKEQYK